MFACSDFTMNLSNCSLTTAQVELLDKGLTYIPVPHKIQLAKLAEGRDRNIRNLKLRDYFRDKNDKYDPKAFINRFKDRSQWVPPNRGLTLEAQRAAKDIANFSERLLKGKICQERTGLAVQLRKSKPNLTRDQLRALQELRNDNRLVIKPADKGGAVVVMDRERYKAEGLRQLTNPHYYREINASLGLETARQINAIITSLYQKGKIDRKQLTYLSTHKADKPRPFYLLPKVHKPRNKWPHPQQPEGRPIVSDSGSETERICEFIDYYLQPLASQHAAYVKDTYDFLNKVRGQSIPENAFLVTGDVTALYTNMSIDRSMAVIKETFDNNPDPNRPDVEILQLLEIALTRNDFEFAGRMFLQVCGTAMGKRFAPSLANIYMRKFDELAMTGSDGKPENYFRFLDDIFFVWRGSLQQLKSFESYINTLVPGIKVTLNPRQACVEFLDLLIYKNNNANGTATLQTKVFFKPTDTHQLLHADSAHPNHTVKGILKSQLIRFKRICSSRSDYDRACTELYQVLRNRGYSRALYRELKYKTWHSNYSYDNIARANNNANDVNKVWPIINYYDKLSVRLAARTRRAISNVPVAQKFKLINAYRIHDNLKRHLCRSRFIDNTP